MNFDGLTYKSKFRYGNFIFHVNCSRGFNVEAVPKKILELMNDEKTIRENVANHLQALILNIPTKVTMILSYQKYRFYLKRINCVVNQQANMATALGSVDSTYLCMGPKNGLRNFHTLTRSN
ncbi:hypothetical protein QQP08_022584 [Theobroma cacao]|nr:hypothetical protein QQP08_022584 [Theobroma cacao]